MLFSRVCPCKRLPTHGQEDPHLSLGVVRYQNSVGIPSSHAAMRSAQADMAGLLVLNSYAQFHQVKIEELFSVINS